MQEIQVGAHDNPKDVARAFCEANKLDKAIQQRIAKYIEKNLPTTGDERGSKTNISSNGHKSEQRGQLRRAHSQNAESLLEEQWRQAFASDSKYTGRPSQSINRTQ